jgi:hypothetical protein
MPPIPVLLAPALPPEPVLVIPPAPVLVLPPVPAPVVPARPTLALAPAEPVSPPVPDDVIEPPLKPHPASDATTDDAAKSLNLPARGLTADIAMADPSAAVAAD